MINTRKTYGFIELNAEELQIIIFKTSQGELKEMIYKLESVIDDLTSYLEEE